MVSFGKFSGEIGLRIFVAALAFGVAADGLVRVHPWGINAAIWVCAFAAVLGYLLRHQAGNWLLSSGMAIFGACIAWRDSTVLTALDVIAIAALCVTIIAIEPGKRFHATLAHFVESGINAAAGVAAGLPLIALRGYLLPSTEANTPEEQHSRVNAIRNSVLGLVISVPILFIFGALFAAADRSFRDLVDAVFGVQWDWIGEHAALTFVATWIVAGYLSVVVLQLRTSANVVKVAEVFKLEALALFIPLALLNALFSVFIVVQLRYFFGGNALVADPNGPSYSEYAREGFFQLVAVAVLALLVLYTSDWLNRETRGGHRRLFRILASILVGLVFVVMASALHRMYLYFRAYGLTELRFYTTIFMFWVAGLLCLFCATVLSGRRDRFIFPALVSGLAVVFLLNVSNPDSIIVRANLANTTEQNPFDGGYAGTLSADAVPALVAAQGRLRGIQRSAVDHALVVWKQRSFSSDWRTWSWGKYAAMRALEATGTVGDDK